MGKICNTCNLEKPDIDFYKYGAMCKNCKSKPALEHRNKNRVTKQYGMNKGDILNCKTCDASFQLKKTKTSIPSYCSIKCRRPSSEIIAMGLAAIKPLTDEQKFIKYAKLSEKLKGRAGRGKNKKGKLNKSAKFYELRDSNMQLHSFKNMAEFVRKNKHLFTEDELKPMGKELYAIIALRNLFSLKKNGEKKVEFWHGWTIGDKSDKSLKKLKRNRDESGKYKKE